MMAILFWNINRRPLIEDIVSLCHSHDVDILILAESELSDVTVQKALNADKERKYIAPFNPSSRLSFYYRYSPESISLVSDMGTVAIRRISPPIGADIILVAVHLSSKLYANEEDQKFAAVRVASFIQEAEERVGHTRTLVIGDFNMNPFEAGLVGADCFHAVMDRNIALEISRKVQDEDKFYFYNPMWSLMGDTSPGPPGTYYYRGSGYISYFWNTFDQILLRPDLLEFFSTEDLLVISQVGEKRSLIEKNKISKACSDHLPILVKLQVERTINQ